MVKKRLRYLFKVLIAIISFIMIFALLQPFFIPKFINNKTGETTVLVNGFSQLDKNSIDVLFLGSSQMFRTVDSARLNDTYHISACNYGASGQSMSITQYYFDEALKSQSPKLIVVEVGCIFVKNSELTADKISWNYAPTPLSTEKIESLEQILESKTKAYEHAFLPLLVYHDRWRVLGEKYSEKTKYDIDYVFNPERYNSLYPYGFVYCDYTETTNYDYNNTDTTLQEIPEESKDTVIYLKEECAKRNIKLLFFKSPASIWKRGYCESVKKYLNSQNLDYIDLNESYNKILLNNNTDFSDKTHLNSSGAKKVTDYLAKEILPAYIK